MAALRDPDSEPNDRRSAETEPFEFQSPDLDGDDTSMDPESMTLEDLAAAEASRPSLPGETVDGLDDMDEEIRHQAEDYPTDTSGRR